MTGEQKPGGLETWTPGRHLHALRMAFFNGGGWADAPEWSDYDEAGQAQWEDLAKSVAAIDYSAEPAEVRLGELKKKHENLERCFEASIASGKQMHTRATAAEAKLARAVEAATYAVGLLPALAGTADKPDRTVCAAYFRKDEILHARALLALARTAIEGASDDR